MRGGPPESSPAGGAPPPPRAGLKAGASLPSPGARPSGALPGLGPPRANRRDPGSATDAGGGNLRLHDPRRWIRTTINYQYRYGMTTGEAMRTLWKEGGGGARSVLRFYRGYLPAIFQGPLSRFGDTAANMGSLELLNSFESTKDLPVASKTLVASAASASWRILITPLDTLKTTMQVEGAPGMAQLMKKVGSNGPFVMWHGALGAATATFVGHYPWFATYNMIDEYLPKYDRKTDFLNFLGTNAIKGFCASAVSDSISNPIRVLKVYRQTNAEPISYTQAATEIVAKDGVVGGFYRGIGTKIVANGLQGIMFSVAWKYISDAIFEKK